MWPGPRPTSIPSDILIHPAVWPQQTWAENWGIVGLCPLFCWGYVYCGQTAGCIKILLGTEAGLGPGEIVLDGDPNQLPHEKGTATFLFFSAHVYCGQMVVHLSNC